MYHDSWAAETYRVICYFCVTKLPRWWSWGGMGEGRRLEESTQLGTPRWEFCQRCFASSSQCFKMVPNNQWGEVWMKGKAWLNLSGSGKESIARDTSFVHQFVLTSLFVVVRLGTLRSGEDEQSMTWSIVHRTDSKVDKNVRTYVWACLRSINKQPGHSSNIHRVQDV